ncbi:BZ3500_MvSof-1268-A1-R1_Chr7-1g09329 [Microbotryum saponariae]|uniref:BZ3500_MvSof-1268-A1-R1_Chr7-1g09329 protein n=1 Tax=Microbotryum saponariae TaxID=289078 RepID=A0A2X0N7K7_9BASI|nr:BZ3501_MvSof-1269-A2-R1_Chr7-1g09034 [Microbotryum saponariae]SDA03242.1 BZ3500_MvSof-1268-A1-R1_Chr7-1g09329 [Microbotryum saponariae]
MLASSAPRSSRTILGAWNHLPRCIGSPWPAHPAVATASGSNSSSTCSSSSPRSFSSSSRSTFIFNRRPPPPTASKLLSELNDARQQERLDLIGKLYPKFVKAARDETEQLAANREATRGTPAPPPVFDHARLRAVLAFVASTDRLDLLMRMFTDLHSLRIQPGRVDHHLLLRGLCKAGKTDAALKWIERMPDTYSVTPIVKDWNVIISGFRRAKQLDRVRATIERMRQFDKRPDVYTYNIAISAAFEADEIAQVRELVQEMQEAEIEADAWTETALLSGFVDKGELASAKIVHRRLVRVINEEMVGKPSWERDVAAVNAVIAYACASEGVKAGVQTTNRYRDQGFIPDAWTLNTLIKYGSKQVDTVEAAIELIEHIEDVTGSVGDRRSWALLIHRLLRASSGGLDQALGLYQEMRDRSVPISSSIVQPLIDGLLSQPSSQSLASAKALYEDLAQASKSYKLGPDHSIYITLLRACASRAHPDLAFSRTLVADMRERGIKLDGTSATWHIIGLMRASSSYEEAFTAYDQIRALDASVYDLQSYNTILSAFTSLKFENAEDSDSAPPKIILEFLSDMRYSNCPADSATYSLLLSYYSRAPSTSTSTIVHLHSLIKLDSSLDPDTPLFNSLMGAYARVGAYSTAYRIWDTLRINAGRGPGPKVDDRSVSIYLDTCGFDGSSEARKRGEDVWASLEKSKFVGVMRNEKHWSSWVEALCRWGRYDEAEKVVFSKEGRSRGGLGMVETLVKMSREDGPERAEKILELVKEHYGEKMKAFY